ncbi:uncharacterized protein JCM6883_005032 [Sporobolomyces salmoneus]|uniref:uncharacterized protein n=1 Tax=Sporobolomyces salmoneus TaxID=183962 RepID=UPI003178A241
MSTSHQHENEDAESLNRDLAKLFKNEVEANIKFADIRGERPWWPLAHLDEVGIQNVDWSASLKNMAILQERMRSGEYLVTFDGIVNPDFAYQRVIVAGKGKLHALSPARRPSPAIKKPFLPNVAEEQWNAHLVTSKEVRVAALKIANHYSTYHSHGGTEAALRQEGRLSRDVEKWFEEVVILFGENQGVWGKLPLARRVVHGDKDGLLTTPPNVSVPGPGFVESSSSYSLSRISHRYARLVGYTGAEAQEGGLEYRLASRRF